MSADFADAGVDVLLYAAGAGILIAGARYWRGDLRLRAAALYALLAVSFTAPALFSARSQTALDYLFQFPPWRSTDVGVAPAANPLLTDVALEIGPFRQLVRTRLFAGESPLWAHELGTGQPLAGNAQSAPFSPLHLAALALPVERGMTVSASWQMLAALLGTHLLAVSLGATRLGAVLAATSFAWSVHSVVWLYYPVGMASAWLPSAAAALLDTWRGRPRAAAALVVAGYGVASSGHPQIALQAALMAATLTLAAAWRTSGAVRRRAVMRLVMATGVVVALSSPMIVAVVETALESERRFALESPPAHAEAWRTRLPFAVAPFAHGSPVDGTWKGEGNFQERATLFAGVVPLALALAGLWGGTRRARALLVGGLGVLLLSSLPGEIWHPLGEIAMVVLDRRCRIFGLLALALAAGLALETLCRNVHSRRMLILALAGLVLAAVLCVPREAPRRQNAWRISAVIAAVSVALSAAQAGSALPAVALAASGLELFVLGFGYNPVSRNSLAGPPPAEIQWLQERMREAPSPSRVAAIGGRLLPYQAAAAGLWDPRGWDPMRPSVAARLTRERLHRLGGQSLILVRTDADLNYLSFLGVRYLLASDSWSAPASWKPLHSSPTGVLWENPAAKPLFFVPRAVARTLNRTEAVEAALIAAELDVAIVEGEFEPPIESGAEVTAIRPISNGFEVEAITTGATLVCSSVTWMPGWSARAESGRELPILRIYGAFVGFVTHPGDGTVTLRYAPHYWRLAVAAAAVALAALLSVGLLRRRFAITLAALSVTACGSPGAAPMLVQRLIPVEPQATFDADSVFAERVVLTLERLANPPLLGGAANPPLADVGVDFEASEVSRVDVTMLGMPHGELHLFWRADGEAYTDARHVFLPGRLVPGASEKVFRFHLALHPGWRGHISGLRLMTGEVPRRLAIVSSIRALGRVDDPVRLHRARSTAWRVSLDDDERSAFFLPAGVSGATHAIAVPRSAALRSAYGLMPGSDQEVSLRVVATTQDGERVEVDRWVIAPSSAGKWHERNVSLSPWEGTRIDLAVECTAPAASPAQRAMAFWADPRVVAEGARSGRPNVLLVSIDTLRADAVGLAGNGPPTTPALAARAAERGVVFTTAVAAAPSTLPSHTSIFTGLDAFRHGAVHSPAALQLTTLAERLRASGYVTVAQTGGGYLHPRWRLDQGFDAYRYWRDSSRRGRELEVGIDRTLAWLARERVEPFFLFFHTYETHAPYRARRPQFEALHRRPPPFEEMIWIEAGAESPTTGFRVPRGAEYRRRGEDPSSAGGESVDAVTARAFYDSSVRLVDEQLERLWRELDRLDLWRTTLVVVTSDHGEAFGEHSVAGHGYLWDSNLLVPLVIFPPGVATPAVETSQVRLVDLLPTIVEFAGGAIAESIDGVSLLPLLRGEGAARHPRSAWSYAGNTNGGVALRIDGRWKWIEDNSPWLAMASRRELYQLDADPGELVNLAGSNPEALTLQREVRARLLGRQSGYSVEFENSTPLEVCLRLSGSAAGPQYVKSLDSELEPLLWSRGGFELNLPPASRRWFVLERGESAELSVERLDALAPGRTGPPSERRRFDVDLAGESFPLLRVWGSEGWRPGERSDRGLVRVRVSQQGVLGGAPAMPGEADVELMRQLRALGYVQ